MPKSATLPGSRYDRRELAPAQFDAIVHDVAQPFSRLVPLGRLIRAAAALTRQLEYPIYDCLHLALADIEGVPVVTADQRLLAAVSGTILAGRLVQL